MILFLVGVRGVWCLWRWVLALYMRISVSENSVAARPRVVEESVEIENCLGSGTAYWEFFGVWEVYVRRHYHKSLSGCCFAVARDLLVLKSVWIWTPHCLHLNIDWQYCFLRLAFQISQISKTFYRQVTFQNSLGLGRHAYFWVWLFLRQNLMCPPHESALWARTRRN